MGRARRILDWYHTLKNVVNGGVAERAVQQDHDEEAAQRAIRWLYYWARNPERKPFFLYVSLSHPHDPYVTPQRYWDRYDHDSIDLPVVPAIAPGEARSLWRLALPPLRSLRI